MNRAGESTLPKSAPTGFVRPRWTPHVLPGGVIGVIMSSARYPSSGIGCALATYGSAAADNTALSRND